MSGISKRVVTTLLGAVALGVLIHAALPVQARMEATMNNDELCVTHTREGVVVASCSETGWLASLVDTSSLLGVQSNFRDPIY